MKHSFTSPINTLNLSVNCDVRIQHHGEEVFVVEVTGNDEEKVKVETSLEVLSISTPPSAVGGSTFIGNIYQGSNVISNVSFGQNVVVQSGRGGTFISGSGSINI
jgi:hypothetical protein